MPDVIVVGGGPAGLHAATLLARQGWDVTLFEEHREPGEPVHCTGVLAAEAYDELDIPREPVLNTLSQVRFFAPSGDVVSYTTPEIEALVIDRRLFDHQLHLTALSAGVRVVAGARVTNVVSAPAGVTVSFAEGPDAQARACILACGANYVLQRRIGLGMPAVFLQSAQVEWPAAPLDAVEVHFGHRVAPSGFAWVVPVQRGASPMARIGLMCEGSAAQHFRTLVARVAGRWGLDAAAGSDASGEPRLKMLPLAPLRKTYADRILAVGDAAGLVKATTGGGIYYSLVSAGLAADVLGHALTADALAEKDLAPYQRLWRKRLGPELDAQLSLRLLANRFTDEEIDSLFDLAQTDGIMPIVRRTARFNRHRELILSLFRHPPARRLFFRRLTSRRQTALNRTP
ncbi:MAG TPA: NAD(P)/FAD-dependent oxidoreductase [Vicinamibacterales bacterium]|nr:NAD(P)/FAD-dependent oxidoreductase [Vicinamibacterales bacterium]